VLLYKGFTIRLFLPHENRQQVASSLFFKYNAALGPPYHILMDTNFINFSIQNKLDIMQSMMDCLYAKCIGDRSRLQVKSMIVFSFFLLLSSSSPTTGTPYITDCVMAELEKLGPRFRVALK
jgi:U3 small nucleolar RNA-associated protein 24